MGQEVAAQVLRAPFLRNTGTGRWKAREGGVAAGQVEKRRVWAFTL